MTKPFNKRLATVFTDDRGQHMVLLPNGEELPAPVKTVVVDEVDSPALARVTFLVNLAKDKDDALSKYNQGG